ncbi:hypothetical protein D3C85_1905030 [compost metagenome]
MRLAGLERQAQRLAFAEQVRLADDVVQSPAAKGFGQGRDGVLREQVRHGRLPLDKGLAPAASARPG